MDKKDLIKEKLLESSELKKSIVESPLMDEIVEIANLMINCYKNNKKVIFMGCGGSAADTQHLAGELVNKYRLVRKSLPAISLSTNTSSLTSVGNDYDFSKTFEKQMEGFANEGDIVIGISTSGNSLVVYNALLKAKENKAITIAFTGQTGGKLKDVADLTLKIPSTDTPRIQEAHLTIGHIICNLVEKELFGEN